MWPSASPTPRDSLADSKRCCSPQYESPGAHGRWQALPDPQPSTLNPQPSEGEALLLALPHADLKVEEACRAITAPLSWGMDGHSFVTFPTPTWQTAMLQGPSASEPLLHCSCP